MLRVLIFIVGMSIASQSYAEMLTVVDTAGVVRSEQSMNEGTGSIHFSLTDDKNGNPDGIEVLLKNQTTGETLTQFSQAGTVVFENVPAGTWVVSTTSSNIVFTSVSIAQNALAGSLGGLGLSSTALTVGGITAITGATVAVAAANDGSSDEMSPSS